MIFLFSFIAIGFLLARRGYLPAISAAILSRFENMLFIPALILGTFIRNFTLQTLSSAWKIFLFSLILTIAAVIPLSILCARFCTKDSYTRKISVYGLSFANFSFMGNAIVESLFPEIFTEYILFTLPMWVVIYVWAIPSLLLSSEREEATPIRDRLKSFINPMFLCMIIGMVIGISGIGTVDLSRLPVLDGVRGSILKFIDVAGSCMSPIAMLLTGITLGSIDLSKILREKSVYTISFFRLLVFPLLGIGILYFFPQVPDVLQICTVCTLAMPIGLNTIVIPSMYGKDTSTAAGMALVSHILSLATIPFIFFLRALILGG